jgi:putative glutamine amidotransferase
MSAPRPFVGIVCDRRVLHGHPFDMAGEKYIAATREGAGTVPLLIPVLDPPLTPSEILPAIDGLLFTGSPSNVAPRRYDGKPPRENTLLDEERDAVALPLLRAALDKGVPTLCICRGFQELNVALGGTLHQHLHETGYSDHRASKDLPIEEQYGPAHDVVLSPGGMLAGLAEQAGVARTVKVNSLHSQGIEKLAPALRVEAEAPDGAIEAVSLKTPKAFLLGVQWHPEWKHRESAFSSAIFGAFGNAVRAYSVQKSRPGAAD